MDYNSPLSLIEETATDLNGPQTQHSLLGDQNSPRLLVLLTTISVHICTRQTVLRGTAQSPAAADGQLRVPISRRWRCATRGQAANPALMEPGDKNKPVCACACVCARAYLRVCVCWMRIRSKNRGGRLLL